MLYDAKIHSDTIFFLTCILTFSLKIQALSNLYDLYSQNNYYYYKDSTVMQYSAVFDIVCKKTHVRSIKNTSNPPLPRLRMTTQLVQQ